MRYLQGELPLEVGRPVHGVLDERGEDEGVDDSLEEPDLSHPAVVEDGVLPVGQSLHEDPVVNLAPLRVAQHVVDGRQPTELDLQDGGTKSATSHTS